MTRFEELNKGLEAIGFKITDNKYVLSNITYSIVNVNGQQYKQPQETRFEMEYIGSGCEVDDSDNDIDETEFFEFNIIGEGSESSTTLCLYNINDFNFFINGK